MRERVVVVVVAAVLTGGCTYHGSAAGTSSSGAPPSTSTSSSAGTSSSSAASSGGSTSSSEESSSAATTRVRVLNCGGQTATSSPATLYLTCGDGTVSVQGIRWSSFGATSAHGAGTLHRRSCTPNCASGKDTTIPAQVTLSDPGRVDGRRLYRRMLVEPAGTEPTTLRLPG